MCLKCACLFSAVWSISHHGPTKELVDRLRPLLMQYNASVWVLLHTIDREFFAAKIFRPLNFRLALFSSLWPLDNITYSIYMWKKIFRWLNFCCWRWLAKIFCDENFPIYDISSVYHVYQCIISNFKISRSTVYHQYIMCISVSSVS